MDETPKDHLTRIDKLLDEYERSIGLPAYDATNHDETEIAKCMNMPREAMERLFPEDCSQIAGVLLNFSVHLTRSMNRDKARITWCDGELRKLATPRMNQYRSCGGSFQHIFDMSVMDDDYTLKLFNIKLYAQERIDRISYIAKGVNDIAENFKEMGRNKRYKEKE